MSLATYTAPPQRREGDKTLIPDLTAAYAQLVALTNAVRTLLEAEVPGLPTLASVATSGKYSDLTGLPTIPAAYTSAMAQALIDQALSPIMAFIGSAGGDADAVVNTVREVLAVMANFPEGVNMLTRLAGIDTALAAVAEVAKRADEATVELPIDYTEETKATSIWAISQAGNLGPNWVNFAKALVAVPAAVAVLTAALGTSGGTGDGIEDSMPPSGLSYTALTGSGFTNREAAQPLTYVVGPPAYFLASANSWNSGSNTGRWALYLPAGTPGALRQRVVDPSGTKSLGGLTLRTVNDLNHASNLVNVELYCLEGKVGYIVDGVETKTTISIAAGEYLVLDIGASVRGFRSVDGVALTELVHEFTNVNPTTVALYPGQNGHFGSIVGEPAQAGFIPLV